MYLYQRMKTVADELMEMWEIPTGMQYSVAAKHVLYIPGRNKTIETVGHQNEAKYVYIRDRGT